MQQAIMHTINGILQQSHLLSEWISVCLVFIPAQFNAASDFSLSFFISAQFNAAISVQFVLFLFQHNLMQRAIMQANKWDSTVEPLARRMDFRIPGWKFKKEFGIPPRKHM